MLLNLESLHSLGVQAQVLDVSSVVMDSREIVPGCLFVCLSGNNFDGHDFALAAAKAGAKAVLVERYLPELDALLNLEDLASSGSTDPVNSNTTELANSGIKDLASLEATADAGKAKIIQVVVPSTMQALGLLANAWRKEFKGKVIGITGTAGKTTVKDLLAQVLGQEHTVAKNALNLNNQIGLPFSILQASGKEDFWVMEAGISQPQDMAELGQILQPDVVLILNAGPGHTQGLGDRGVAHYKASFLKYLQKDGLGLVSADYPDLVREARAILSNLTFFSVTGRQVDYRAAYVVPAGEQKGIFRLWLDGESVDVEAPFRGSFGAENVIAVATLAHSLGLDVKLIAKGLGEAKLPMQRFCCSHCGAWLVIDDTYNANPLSFMRMLEATREMAKERALVCMLGEMGELGPEASTQHEILGRNLAAAKPKAVFWKGKYFEEISTGLKRERYSGLVKAVNSVEEFKIALAELGFTEGAILFKGSRSNKLEEYLKAFIAQTGEVHAL